VSSIVQQRYTAAGAKIGGAVLVNTDTESAKSAPDIAALAGDQWVIAWVSDGQDGSSSGVFGQRFDALGKKLGSEVRLSTSTRGAQTQPSLAGFPGGGYAVAWTSTGDGSGTGVYLQRYDASGAAADRTIRINSTVAGSQDEPDVAALSRRDFVVAWTSEGQDQSLGGVYAQRFKLGIDASLPFQ